MLVLAIQRSLRKILLQEDLKFMLKTDEASLHSTLTTTNEKITPIGPISSEMAFRGNTYFLLYLKWLYCPTAKYVEFNILSLISVGT